MKSEQQCLRYEDNSPNVEAMISELERACELASELVSHERTARATRLQRWANQRDDGRKPDTPDVTPWPSASDCRVMLVDEICNDHVAIMKAAARRASLTVLGRESTDTNRAAKVQLYLDYLRRTRMQPELGAQIELGAQWRQTYARALMSIVWKQEWARAYDDVSIESLRSMAAADPQGQLAQLLASLYEPDREVWRSMIVMLTEMYPDLDKAEASRQLSDLKRKGTMRLPRRHLRVNEPRWRALRVWEDVFYPTNTESIQKAAWVAERETLNEAQLEERIVSEEWDADFVDAVKKTGGMTVLDRFESQEDITVRRNIDRAEQMEGLYEVFYVSYVHTADDGIPERYRTVISPHIPVRAGDEPLFGFDGPLGYDHGRYPYVELRRERLDAQIEQTRSVPAIGVGSVAEVKLHRDARANQSELFLQPPMIRPERELNMPLRIRPRGEIGERRANTTRPFTFGAAPQLAEPLEASAERDLNRYFARNRAEDPVRAGLYEQNLVDDWCEELAECWKMTLQLAQQFEDDVRFSRIVGNKPESIVVSEDEIQGAYDLKLYFNTEQLDPDRMRAKTELLQKVIVPLDRYSVLNQVPIIATIFAQNFPELADVAIQDVKQGSQKEIEDEQKNFALIMAGEEPPMHDDGQNFALRLQWWQQKLQQPGAQQRLSALPDSAQLVDKRLKHLQFQVQQSQNAVTGRLGVAPQSP